MPDTQQQTPEVKALIEAAQEAFDMLLLMDPAKYFNGYNIRRQRIKLKAAIEAVKKEGE